VTFAYDDYRYRRRPPLVNSAFWSHIILISAVAYALFNRRIILGVSTGGRGNLQVLDLWIPTLALFISLGAGSDSTFKLIRRGYNSLFWMPYVVITVALPVLAIIFQNYPLRNIYTASQGLVAFAFIILGAWIAAAGKEIPKLVSRYAATAVVGEALAALIDYLNKTGLYPSSIGRFLLQWNVASENTLGEYSFLSWRCVGTFVSPNELGFWSVMAFWISARLVHGSARIVAMVAALLTLVLSQSRGSLFALIGTLALWIGYLVFSRDPRLRRVRDVTLVSVLFVILAAAWIGVVLSQSSNVSVADEFSFIERFQNGLRVIVEGPSADSNADARLMAWRSALQFYYSHPLGTWATPRLVFGHYIDNDYVRTFVQGSPLYLIAMLLALFGGIRQITGRGSTARTSALFAGAIAINGMSAYPLLYPCIGLYWLNMGYDMARRPTRTFVPAPPVFRRQGVEEYYGAAR
jgi:hypothetical protein